MNSMVKKHTGIQCMYTEQKSTVGNLMYNKTNKGTLLLHPFVCLFACLFSVQLNHCPSTYNENKTSLISNFQKKVSANTMQQLS